MAHDAADRSRHVANPPGRRSGTLAFHECEDAMKRLLLILTFAGLALSMLAARGATSAFHGGLLVSGQGGDPHYGKPKRLNKMIELLAAGQPVYDAGVTGGGYEEGKKLAQTTNDLIQERR